MDTHNQATKDYCNVLAMQKGLDPAGSAGNFEDAILLETPLPWKRSMYEKAGPLPQELIDLLALWLERYRAGAPYSHRPLMIAPDADYSFPGHRRVIYYARKTGPFAAYERREYLVPDEFAGPLIWALFEDRQNLGRFHRYAVPVEPTTRDLLVCTHGTVDVACAKFGFPLYQHLRSAFADDALRVWRVSHFGGHVFAPTLMEMPTGHYWAYMEAEQAEAIVNRSCPPQQLRGHYRGWAGVAHGFAQAAERELWLREGWAWFDFEKSATVLAQDEENETPEWMELAFDSISSRGEIGRDILRVEITHRIETIPSTGYDDGYAYPQYAVTTLEKARSEPVVA